MPASPPTRTTTTPPSPTRRTPNERAAPRPARDAASTRIRKRPKDPKGEAAVDAAPIHYQLSLADPAGHLFEIRLTVQTPDPAGQRLALPAWIPGSYLIREFARHVVQLNAKAGRRALAVDKLDKHTWQVAPCKGPLTIVYRVYGWDLSVRGAHFDRQHAFFNGTSVFLRVLGQENAPCLVDLLPPTDEHLSRWRVATTLPRAGARPWQFGRYRAASYDELIDHPVEMGTFSQVSFEACGVMHDMVITGRHDADLDRIGRDLKPICEAQIRLFEPRSAKAPFERYLFMTTAIGDGYGGLEHRSSTALICQRNDLPSASVPAMSDGYRGFLGLCSHEYFHSWHVKRIKPARFAPYDLNQENYTRLLWVFEGFTSYYDDLMLRRAGVIDDAAYLQLLSGTMSNVQRTPGRARQSVAESSFDAWSKYYRQDENSPNVIVSYYTKGALVALCIDLSLRARSGGKASLDDVMRELWRRFGRDFDVAGQGLGEQELAPLIAQATGIDLADEIRAWAHGTQELPLVPLLSAIGVDLSWSAADPAPWLGARWTARGAELALTTVFVDGPAHQAGLSAGDVLVALDDLKVTEASLKAMLARRKPGARVRIHAFRRDELIETTLKLAAPPAHEAKLAPAARASRDAQALRRGWLAGR
ncbi:MAG: M61 family metallopeptidase [Burkholderiaceae bacterium]